jgi:hypothetical protein
MMVTMTGTIPSSETLTKIGLLANPTTSSVTIAVSDHNSFKALCLTISQ